MVDGALMKEVSVLPPQVNTILVEIPEPVCPFCGKMLNNANCLCRKFGAALKRFKIRNYGTEDINVQAYEIKIVNACRFDRSQAKVTKLSPALSLPLYPQLINGKTFHLVMCGSWQLTPATWDGKQLTFYFIKKGDDVVYKCQLPIPSLNSLEYNDVNVYRLEKQYKPRLRWARRHGAYGGCAFVYNKKVIATLGYSEYLQKLQRR